MQLHVLFTGRVRKTGAPVLCYLIRARDATVLVDTGYPRDRAGAHRTNPQEPIELEPGEDVVSRLRALGVEPGDVDLLVCSHFDPDHAGNHDAFPDAELVVQRRHHEWARATDSPRVALTRDRWDRADARLRLVDGDTELLPGVELVASDGHVPGHQSVLVRLAQDGPVLLAIDAIPTAEALDAGSRPVYPLDMDEAEVRGSTKKLTDLARAEGAWIVHGHDAEAAKRLRVSPRHYS